MTTKPVKVVICRACVGECKEYKSLFKQGLIMGEVSTLASLLAFCTNLEFVDDESGLPSFICTKCVYDLVGSYIFKKKVLQANEILSGNLDEDATCNAVRKEDNENVIVINDAEADLQELAEAAQMKREQLEQQLFNVESEENENGEFLNLTVLDSDGEDENQHQNDEDPEPEEMELEYMEQDVAETTEIYHTTIITDEMQHLDDDGEIEQEQQLQHHEDIVEEGEKTEYEIQVNDIEEDYTELLSDSQDGVSQQSFKRPTEDATNSASDNSLSNPSKRRRINSTGKVANPDYQCKICGKQLSNSSSFKYHMKLHSDETPYKCEVCGEAFKTRNAYDGHISIHNPNNPNTCKLCGKSYRQPSSLRMHMLTHSGIKPFTCEICGKSLTQKSGYKKHMLTHTGEKPYSCDICNKSFCISSNMLVHRRSHTDQKQHQCTECDKSFLTADQLKRHGIIHSDERPFSCGVCGKQFKRQTAWRSHLQTHQELKTDKSIELLYSDEYEENNREKTTVVEIF
ncbi:zinc finger protein 226 [Calliphora vicina]|uniref:zinc finger protein 226 n=1 Tax=Calliphora vicina TaxID=7373 RepID=UPI00325AD078